MNFWVCLHHIGIFELFVLTFQSITSSNLLSRFYPFFFSKIWSCYLWYLEDDDKVGEGGDGGAKKRKGNTQIQRKYVFWCGFYWPLDGVSITCCSSGKKNEGENRRVSKMSNLFDLICILHGSQTLFDQTTT